MLNKVIIQRALCALLTSVVLPALGDGTPLAGGAPVSAPAASALAASSAGDPSAAVQRCALFPQPVVWVGEQAPVEADTARLLAVLPQELPADPGAAFAAVERFVLENPGSGWAPSLRLQLAAYYDAKGSYTPALRHYRGAWEAAEFFASRSGKSVGDTALARWTEAAMRLGNLGELDAAVKAGGTRKMSDLTGQFLLYRSRGVQQRLETLPATSFRCGTLSLVEMAPAEERTRAAAVKNFPSPKGGFSLFTLQGLAKELSLELVAVRRPKGDSRLTAPSLVHFSLNHYAAILEIQGARARVFDTAAGGIVWRDLDTINGEASGAFLVEARATPTKWSALGTAEASAITGGCSSYIYPPPPSPCDEEGTESCPSCPPSGATPSTPPCSSCGPGSTGPTPLAMPTWEVTEPFISIWLKDKPMAYRTSHGAEVALKLYYHQHDGIWRSPVTDVFSFGTNWGSNWRAYLEITNQAPSDPTWSNSVGWLTGPGASVRFYSTTNGTPSYARNTVLQTVVSNGALAGFREVFPSGATTYYELLQSPNGSSTARRAFLTRRVDSQTNTTRFNYTTNNGRVLLCSVVDSDGRTNTLRYDTTVPTFVAEVQSPVATNCVRFTYNTNALLQSLVDIAGMTSSFEYDSNFVWSLTALVTPYGRTEFSDPGPTNSVVWGIKPFGMSRAVTVTEPTGAKHLVAYHDWQIDCPQQFPCVISPESLAPMIGGTNIDGLCNYDMCYRNSFYWGPRHYPFLSSTDPTQIGCNDFRIARRRNWLHIGERGGARDFDGTAIFGMSRAVSDTLNMEAEASPNPESATPLTGEQTWYAYSGKDPIPPGEVFEGTNRHPDYVAKLMPNGETHYVYRTYNPLGRTLTQVSTYSVPGGVATRTNINTYAANGQDLISVTNAAGIRAAAYGYNSLHQVLFETNALNEVTSFTYDAARHKTSSTDARGHTTTNTYCPCGSLESTTDPMGNTTTYTYDARGRATGINYSGGPVLVRYYNLLGQVTNEVSSGGDNVTNYYNRQGMLVAASNSFGGLFERVYDIDDHLASATDANGITVTNAYDPLGRVIARGPVGGVPETFGYSARGMVAYTNQIGASNFFGFDEAGRKRAETNANREVTFYTYSPAGEMLTLTDAKSQTTTWKYDLYGRLTNKLDHAGAAMFRYSYDASGRLTNRWTPAKLSTGYAYDAAGNLTNIDYTTSPDVRMAYDADNRLTNQVDAVGTTGYRHTATGLLACEDGPWDNDAVTYDYTNGRRTGLSVAQPGADPWTQTFGFDSVGRLTNTVSGAGTFDYAYSAQVLVLALPGGLNVTTGFDALGRLTSTTLMTDWNSVMNYHGYGYDDAGQRLAVTNTYGGYVLYTYDNQGQLKTALGSEHTATNSSARAHEVLRYAYDPAGNLAWRTNNGLVQGFTVNYLNQLTNITRTGTLTVSGAVLGAATNVTVNGAGAILYSDNSFAREGLSLVDGDNSVTAVARDNRGRADSSTVTANLPATVSPAYDANGNMVANGPRVLAYDDENQLVSVQVPGQWKSDFQYDGKMRRRVRTEATYANGAWLTNLVVRYVYDGNLVVQERHYTVVAGALVPRETVAYTRGRDLSGTLEGAGGIGGLLARSSRIAGAAGTWAHAYYHSDANGNVTALASASGSLIGRYLYDPFGNTLGVAGAAAEANLYRFSSKEWHAASGLVYYLYRYYEPSLQRWVNRDPVLEIGGFNLYKYSENDPVSLVDPFGHAALCPAMPVIRFLGTRVAPRFIPGVGWVLIAVDVYLISTYVYDKCKDLCKETTTTIEKPKPTKEECMAELKACLEDTRMPDWNVEAFGPVKDCGACFKECKGPPVVGWPDYKCPR